MSACDENVQNTIKLPVIMQSYMFAVVKTQLELLYSVMANHPDRSNQLPIFGKQVQLARAAHMNQAELIVSPSFPVYSMSNQTVLVPSIGYFALFLSFFLRKSKTFNIKSIEHIQNAVG